MRSVPTFTATGLALCFAASSSYAVGFGRVSNSTQLGQPLNFYASVHLDPDEILPRECVSAEVQSGENKLQPQQVRVTLEGAGDSTERSVRVTTSALIDEPVVTVSVTVGCNSKVTRRFVAFIDPPLIDAPRTAQIDAPPPPQRVDSQVAPIVSIVQGTDGLRARAAAPNGHRFGLDRALPRRLPWRPPIRSQRRRRSHRRRPSRVDRRPCRTGRTWRARPPAARDSNSRPLRR